jgi:tetratricopeptide (TPR) repeat protein
MAATARTLGEVYLEGAQLSNALVQLERALEIERGLAPQDGGRIVAILRRMAEAHEARGELERAALRHHEALVYQDARFALDDYIQTLQTLGRLYQALRRPGEAARAFSEALRADERNSQPARAAALTVGLAAARAGQGFLEEGAALYAQALPTLPATARAEAEGAQAALQSEIDRHMATLAAAEQSLQLLTRAGAGGLQDTVFVLALRAQALHALGRHQAAEDQIEAVLTLLAAQSEAVRTGGGALAALLAAHESEMAGGQADYIGAAALTGDAALRWLIHHRAAQKSAARGTPSL